MAFIMRWLVTAIAAGVAVWLIPGIDIIGGTEAWVAIALFGLVLSLTNIIIKPILEVLSLPITCLTLGIFYLVINVAVIYIAAGITNGLFGVGIVVSGFFSALFASIVISIVSAIVNFFIGD
ncbi:MAG: phage holin family protein [Eggerthellaceae bacterium]|nr:phage holin family protein [Eggerthellaceae bacterium]